MKYILIWQDTEPFEGEKNYKLYDTLEDMEKAYNDLISEYAAAKNENLEFLFAGEIRKEFDVKITEVVKKIEFTEKHRQYISL